MSHSQLAETVVVKVNEGVQSHPPQNLKLS
jgi:hypothetical protein